MKEATGELNMTVIVIVAIVAVGALFTIFVYPMIKTGIVNQTCKTYGSGYTASVKEQRDIDGDGKTDTVYQCCDKDKKCITVENN